MTQMATESAEIKSVTLSVGIDQGQESVVNTTDITAIAQLWADFKDVTTREARDRLIVH